MATYKYLQSNPLPFTLPDGTEHILGPGKTFELPSENDYIRGLIEQGYLQLVEPVADAPKKPIRSQLKD